MASRVVLQICDGGIFWQFDLEKSSAAYRSIMDALAHEKPWKPGNRDQITSSQIAIPSNPPAQSTSAPARRKQTARKSTGGRPTCVREKAASIKDTRERHDEYSSAEDAHRLEHDDDSPSDASIATIVLSDTSAMESDSDGGEQPKDKPKQDRCTCADCGQVCPDGYHLRTHMRVHTGEKPFQCKVCGKAFVVSSSCLKHERTHTGDRPYKYACGTSFTQSCNLRRHHRLVYAIVKPFKCALCHKTFGQLDRLRMHENTHTGDKPFTCGNCGKAYAHCDSLGQHMRREHPVAEASTEATSTASLTRED